MNFKHLKNWKRLFFKQSESNFIDLNLPNEFDQSAFNQIDYKDYAVLKIRSPYEIPESAVVELKKGNNIVGYLIPGQTILSADYTPNNYCIYHTYNFLIALHICNDSWKNKYTLCSKNYVDAIDKYGIFDEGVYYCIVNLKRLNCVCLDDFDIYLNSFLLSDLYFESDKKNEPVLKLTDGSRFSELRLRKNKPIPEYIRKFFKELIPYEKNNILRFFYVYQVVEIIMAIYLDEKYEEIRGFLVQNTEVTKNVIRDKISEISDAAKEKNRINEIFTKSDESISNCLDSLFICLSENVEKFTFAEKVYKLRNMIFHDYARVINYEDEIGVIADKMAMNLLNRYQCQ